MPSINQKVMKIHFKFLFFCKSIQESRLPIPIMKNYPLKPKK